MNRGGQFYLIATIVIIALIVGLFAVANYSNKNETSKVEDLAKELREESARVRDYEVASSDSKINEFTSNFSKYAGYDVEIYYVTGNSTNFQVYTYNESGKQLFNDFNLNGNLVILTIHESDYSFSFREGQNFYFVMYQELQGGVYVQTS